jgi:hypothetical protein
MASGPRIDFDHAESLGRFSFRLVEEDEVFNSAMSLESDAMGFDG